MPDRCLIDGKRQSGYGHGHKYEPDPPGKQDAGHPRGPSVRDKQEDRDLPEIKPIGPTSD